MAAGDSVAAAERLRVLEGIPEIQVTGEVGTIADRLLMQASLPSKARLDALHIANAAFRFKIERVIRTFGYEPPLICTPQELVEV